MKGAIVATAHLKDCVQLLLSRLYNTSFGPPTDREKEEAFAATFELIDQPWTSIGTKDELIWREGYEQCMKDIVDALADEWGVSLPADPMRKASDGGDKS